MQDSADESSITSNPEGELDESDVTELDGHLSHGSMLLDGLFSDCQAERILLGDYAPNEFFKKLHQAHATRSPESTLTAVLPTPPTPAYMQRLVEELRGANEEAQFNNEELQCTNEELQTVQEELQSSNEELTTSNEEMHSQNSELCELNNDLVNVLSSIQTPIVMLNGELRIRRYTPTAEKVLHLIPTDIGRLISEIKPRINVPDLEDLLRRVISSMEPFEREVQHEDGRWYCLRIQPYKTAPGRVEGAVLQLLDIDQKYRHLFEAAKDGIMIINADTGEINDVNPFLIQLLGIARADLIGKRFWQAEPLRDLQNHHVVLDRLRKEEVLRFPEVSLKTKSSQRELQVEVVANMYEEGGKRVAQFNIRDITERKEFDLHLQQTARLESLGLLAGGIAHDFNNLLVGILGNAGLALADAPTGTPYQSALKDVVYASQRAADLPGKCSLTPARDC